MTAVFEKPPMPRSKRQSASMLTDHVAAILRAAGYDVHEETVASDVSYDIVADRYFREKIYRYAVECKTMFLGATEAEQILARWASSTDRTITEFWLILGVPSPRVYEAFKGHHNRYRVFSVEELEEAVRERGARDLRGAKGRKTKIGRSISANSPLLLISCAAVLVQVEDKLKALNSERPNSKQAITERKESMSDYETLRTRLIDFRDAIVRFQQQPTAEAVIVQSTSEFANGIKSWWQRSHQKICDKAFDMSMFLSAVTICSLAGAGGQASVVVSAALVGGRPVADAMKSIGKKIFGF